MPEVDLDFPRAFAEFTNPEDDSEIIRCDLTWLTSSYTCIFGNGCPGIYATAPSVGCCTLGAHFADSEDRRRTATSVAQLSPEDWQFHPGRKVRKRDWVEVDEDGDEKTLTHEVDGQQACVFANRPDFSGGAGCALHGLALKQGRHPLETKPDVCWQLPIRRTFREVERTDESSYTEVTISEYDRRGWGGGGHDFDWYCSGNTEAHVAAEPVYLSHAAELTELIGVGAYRELVRHCEERMAGPHSSARHPADPQS